MVGLYPSFLNPTSTESAVSARENSDAGLAYKRMAAACRAAGERSYRVPRPSIRNLSPHADRFSIVPAQPTKSSPATNLCVLIGVPQSALKTIMRSGGGRDGKSYPFYGVVKPRIAANRIPGAIDVQKDEAWRVIAECRVQVLERPFLVPKLGVGTGEVEG